MRGCGCVRRFRGGAAAACGVGASARARKDVPGCFFAGNLLYCASRGGPSGSLAWVEDDDDDARPCEEERAAAVWLSVRRAREGPRGEEPLPSALVSSASSGHMCRAQPPFAPQRERASLACPGLTRRNATCESSSCATRYALNPALMMPSAAGRRPAFCQPRRKMHCPLHKIACGPDVCRTGLDCASMRLWSGLAGQWWARGLGAEVRLNGRP